ncbi:cytochrome P450 71A8-like [Salvia miltiorrhiza]|uniref:cytochrome P450 71A8-like n=1 Tax=Salvia miltiorrhiza TaxID=226208 RepID=UPI0025AB801A|nr:cytochrome P450 71A8-like [Salvia miltiorrhiza]
MLSFQQQIDLHPYLLLSITLFSLYYLSKWLCKKPSNKRVPPSPPKLPILGNLHQLSVTIHHSLQSLGAKYGPLMLLYLGKVPVMIVQSADGAAEILKKHDLIFADKPRSRTTRRLFYDLKDISVAPYGEYWRKLKSLCVLQLLSGKMVQSFNSIREEETALLMEEIKSRCLSCSPVNLSDLFEIMTNNVVCRAAFGKKYSEEESGKRFLMLLRETLELLGSSISIGEFIPWLSWINRVNGFNTRVDKVADEVDGFLELVVQEHLNGGEESVGDENRESFVDILLNIYKDNDAGIHIGRDSIKAIILDILAGGTDTTSATLEWAMTELLRHPIILKKLQTGVREILGDKQEVTNEDLVRMQYLKAVVKETLRLHPPVAVLARVAREDATVMGYDVACGTMVLINTWAIGRDPASWDEPEVFRPDRFLNSSVDFKGLDLELIPFGAGRRGCPGIAFAMASVELVLANLVHRFEWKLEEELDITELPGTTIRKKYPLLAVATHCYL